METHSHHLTLENRCDLARLHAAGLSLRHIAATLDRPPSTVVREMTRNRSRTQDSQPRYADQQARARRWRGAKLARDAPLRTTVLTHLQQGWTPEQVARAPRPRRRAAGSFSRNHLPLLLRPDRPDETLCVAPLSPSRQSHPRRPAQTPQPRRLARPPPPPRRPPRRSRRPSGPGPRGSRSDALPHRRTSRHHSPRAHLPPPPRRPHPPGKAAVPVAHTLIHFLTPVPLHGRQTVTFDNGTEFAGHYHLHALGIETFFCNPHAPGQKGGGENAIGRLRRTLPRKTDLATLSDQRFHHLVHAYNHIPRKDLGYVTPAEIFIHQVVHLKCESTMPHRRLSPVKFRRVIFIGVEGKSDRAFAKFLRRCCDKDGLHLHLKIATGYDGRSVVVVQEALAT